jgi:predicted ATP-binding protein involved in virulence
MSHPDSKQLANFHAAVQTMKLYRRAEIEDARGESLIEELYVDPLPHDHVLETMLRPSTTFLIGRKGSGKSTVFQRVQHKLAKDRRAASAYVDIKTVFESARVDPQLVRKIDSEGSALNAERVHELLLMSTFIKATVRGIRDGLSRQSVSWIQRMKDSFTGSTAELFADLDDYLDRINKAN